MSDLHSFTLEMGQLGKDLEQMGRSAPLIMARSLNRAVGIERLEEDHVRAVVVPA